jgi:hypothetical protein
MLGLSRVSLVHHSRRESVFRTPKHNFFLDLHALTVWYLDGFREENLDLHIKIFGSFECSAESLWVLTPCLHESSSKASLN